MIFLLHLLTFVFSYTPHSHFILEKVSDNNGKGAYRILQESIFQNSKERIIVQETWTIEEGLKMHLEAKGPDISYTAKYDFSAKYTYNDKGNIRRERLSKEFFESLYYLKTAKDIANRIYRLKLSGSEILKPQKRFYDLKQVEYKGQNFIRLDKYEGKVAYQITESSNERGEGPGLWIAQNDFHILKIRFPSEAEVNHYDYEKFSKNLFLPKERMINWENNKTPLRLLKVSSIDLGQNEKQLLNKNTKAGLSENRFGSSSLSRVIKTFYNRYR